jgi:hypothetical protein
MVERSGTGISNQGRNATMMRVLVRYRVKADNVAENERLVQAVYRGLQEIGDPDVHYATFKLNDGCTFVHIASFASKEKQPVLTESPAFKAFQAGLKDRCDQMPDSQPLTEVGSYRFV